MPLKLPHVRVERGVPLLRNAFRAAPAVRRDMLKFQQQLVHLMRTRRNELVEKPVLAVDTLRQMVLEDLPPQPDHYLLAIRAHHTHKNYQEARAVWEFMESRKAPPTYALLALKLRISGAAGQTQWADEVWEKYCKDLPWLSPDSPDPLPPSPRPRVSEYSLEELRALPMWMKIEDLNPRYRAEELNRWNCTREIYLERIKTLCIAGRIAEAEALLNVLQEKLLTTPTPEPPPLRQMRQREPPSWKPHSNERAMKLAQRYKSDAEYTIRKLSGIPNDTPSPDPWVPDENTLGPKVSPHKVRAGFAYLTNGQFLGESYIHIIRSCTADLAHALHFANRFLELCRVNPEVAAFKADGPSPRFNEARKRVRVARIDRKKKSHDIFREVLDYPSGHPLSEVDKCHLRDIFYRAASDRRREAWRLAEYGSSAEEIQLQVSKLAAEQAAKIVPAVADRIGALGLPHPNTWVSLPAVMTRNEEQPPSPVPLTPPPAAPSQASNPPELAPSAVQGESTAPKGPGAQATTTGTATNTGLQDITVVVDAVLGAALESRKHSGNELLALFRQLSNFDNSGPLQYGDDVELTLSEQLYSKLVFGYLEHLGFPSRRRGAVSELQKRSTVLVQALEPLTEQHEGSEVGPAVQALWEEMQRHSLTVPLATHNAILLVLAATRPAPGCVHQHFEQFIFEKYEWDEVTAACLFMELLTLPTVDQRRAAAQRLVTRCQRYIKDFDSAHALLDLIDRHHERTGFALITNLERRIRAAEKDLLTRWKSSPDVPLFTQPGELIVRPITKPEPRPRPRDLYPYIPRAEE